MSTGSRVMFHFTMFVLPAAATTSLHLVPATFFHVNASHPLQDSLGNGRVLRNLVERQSCVGAGYSVCPGFSSCCPAGGECCTYGGNTIVSQWPPILSSLCSDITD